MPLLTSGIMLQVCSQLLHRVPLRWPHAGPAPLRCFSVARPSHGQRDYGLPNATWSQNTLDLYRKYEELSKSGAWRRIPSYDGNVHHVADLPPEKRRVNRVFTRNLDQDGVGFEYSMFYSAAEKRMVCIFQPGPYLEGPPGYTHGGCTATILDITLGTCAVCLCGPVLTASLNVDLRNPILIGCTVIVDCHVEKVEGRKVWTRGQIRSHDDRILYTEATGLLIKLNPGNVDRRTD